MIRAQGQSDGSSRCPPSATARRSTRPYNNLRPCHTTWTRTARWPGPAAVAESDGVAFRSVGVGKAFRPSVAGRALGRYSISVAIAVVHDLMPQDRVWKHFCGMSADPVDVRGQRTRHGFGGRSHGSAFPSSRLIPRGSGNLSLGTHLATRDRYLDRN